MQLVRSTLVLLGPYVSVSVVSHSAVHCSVVEWSSKSSAGIVGFGQAVQVFHLSSRRPFSIANAITWRW